MDAPNVLMGLEAVWPHHSSLPFIGHRSLTLTTMVFPNGGVNGGYGNSFGVILKQRPQASPEDEWAPNASSFTAAVYPESVDMPHAGKDVAPVSVDSMGYQTAKIDAELTGNVTAPILCERRSTTVRLDPATIRTSGHVGIGLGRGTTFVRDAM